MPLNPRDVALLREIVAQLQAGLTTSDADTVTELQGIATQLGGTLDVLAPADVSQSQTLNGLGQALAVPIVSGYRSFSFYITGTFTGTLTAQASYDGGGTYPSSLPCVTASASAPQAVTALTTAGVLAGSIPPGVTHIRLYFSAFTTGSATVKGTIGVSDYMRSIVMSSGSATLTVSNARAGFIGNAGIWYDESSTPLASGATFTGTSRDATATAGSNTFNSTGTFAEEVRCLAVSDVAGTLHLEVSRDNVTFRRIDSVATAAVGGSGLHVAKIKYEPATRYYRFVYVNGGTGQAHFLQQTIAMAA